MTACSSQLTYLRLSYPNAMFTGTTAAQHPPPGENFYDLISLPTILWQMAGKCWLLKSHQISHELKQGTPVLQILCLLQL